MPMKEKTLDGARTQTTFDTYDTVSTINDVDDAHSWAHTAAIERVVDALQTDVQCVLSYFATVSYNQTNSY